MTREEAIKILNRPKSMKGVPAEILEAHAMAIKALEQEPCKDEYIKVPKKTLKYRIAGMVAYNAEWLKNNFDMERAVICGEQEQKTGHWIPVSERLPEDESRVLVTIQTPMRSKVRSGMFDNERFYNDNGDTWKVTDKEVKAWMPLPEPYRAESEVQDADSN